MTEIPLFDIEQPPKLKRIAPVNDKPRWRRLSRRTLQHCADCLEALHQAKGAGPLPLQAYWVRIANGVDRPLCSEHAGHWRELDKA